MRIFFCALIVSFAVRGQAPNAHPPADPFAEDLPLVEAASLHTQTLDEAPASVTVIGHAEIRTHGYRTLGEALGSVRGFFLSSDHIYQYAGVRAFSLPGDFNTRFLVMINGHPMTDNVFSSNGLFQQDFGLDMDLVERIEVVRGPSSALYGSNGIFATINIVTVAPVDFAKAYGSMEAGTFGEKKALAAGSFYLGRGANLLVSASLINSTGQSFYFPQFDSPKFGFGRAESMDGERGYHTFSTLTWHNWSIAAYFNERVKNVPLAWVSDANSFFSRGNRVAFGRRFVNAAYTRILHTGTLRWQISYDEGHYRDRFDILTETLPALSERSSYADGDWLSSRLTYQFAAGRWGSLTAGLEGRWDLRSLQYDREISPEPAELLRISRPDRSGAIFLQQEKRLSPRWKLDVGVRFDETRYYDPFVSPRVALTFQRSARTVYKIIYGRPFRNPNAYEQFYHNEPAVLQAPPLNAESAHTVEITAEHHFRRNFSAGVNFYDYQLRDLIQTVYDDAGTSRFLNAAKGHSRGAEIEVGGKPLPWLEASGSFTWQHADLSSSAGMLPNSPARLGKFQWTIPFGRRVVFAGNVQAMSSRLTYTQQSTRPVVLADLTATVRRAIGGCDLTVGARNLLNWGYDDPAGLSLDRLRGDPRSLFMKLAWSLGR